MHVISALRSLLAAPRRGVTGALLIALVIAGVVSMHSMSASPSVHLSPAGAVATDDVAHASPAEAMAPGAGFAEATPAQVPPVHTHVAATPDGAEHAGCAPGCDAHDQHDMTTAMCLMVLAVLLTLAAPPASFLHAVVPAFARRRLAAGPRSRPAAAPSLCALGISRT
ncbi:hypothetical protein C8K30_10650 [Promicromonospora sp. AC04]|uniref:hypothetical protein n=1 Tax=Promicromonospora sp. AC04 TaxID=2135723 RepID=UPI000D417DED|nr:hypothetical protein [Promicromonospora sp. AC04]PUB25963.1 hypothetical protein C8K30_10650 [Promicromonospora sp. AC04]